MIKRIFVCVTHCKDWRIGQYFIVDEDYENAITAKPIQSGPRGQFRVQPTGMIEIPFDQIKPFVREVSHRYGNHSDE